MNFKLNTKLLILKLDALLDLFLESLKEEPYMIRLKAKALLSLNGLAFLINLLYFIFSLNTSLASHYIINFFVLVIISINIFLLRKGKYERAGNFLTLSFILLFILSSLLLSEKNSFTSFIEEFYFLLSFLVLSLLFTTEKRMLINALIIALGSFVFYVLRTEQNSDIAFNTIINYEFVVVIITIILFVFSKIIKRTMDFAEEKTQQFVEQKNNALLDQKKNIDQIKTGMEEINNSAQTNALVVENLVS